MLLLGLVSSDDLLGRAIGEQFKGVDAWQLALFPSLEEALAAWSGALPPLLLWDAQKAPAKEDVLAFFCTRLQTVKPAPLLLLLGDVPGALKPFGVTECFTRPLRLGHLIARLFFYGRVLQQEPDISFNVGPWLFSPRQRVLVPKEGGEALKLTDKESSLLSFLCATPGVVSRDELLAAVWGYKAEVDTHTLETHIYRLRRKLTEGTSTGEDVFLTEAGGYRLNPSWRGA